MSLVGRGIRLALGKGLPAALTPRPEPFFATRADLLRLFGLGIAHKRHLQERTFVARRKGLSAKSPYARAKGYFHEPAGSKLARKVSRGGLNMHPTTPCLRAFDNLEAQRRARRESERWDRAHGVPA